MPIRLEIPQTFHQLIRERQATQVGLWVCSGSATAAEIVASSGCDWVLVDGEHSPIGLESTLEILRSMGAYPAVPVVRVPVNDTALIKQFLDLGAQNIMVPMVHTVEDAEKAVAAMHYPPRGVRGVGSALARSARWNRVEGYLHNGSEHVSLIVQVESAESAENAEAILAVEGVDAVFIGLSDLAASMGLLGQQNHQGGERGRQTGRCQRLQQRIGPAVHRRRSGFRRRRRGCPAAGRLHHRTRREVRRLQHEGVTTP